MSTFPSADRLRRLIAAKCCGPKVPNQRQHDASTNELHTDLAACHLVALGHNSTDRGSAIAKAKGGVA